MMEKSWNSDDPRSKVVPTTGLSGAIGWLRRNLFAGYASSAVTVLLVLLIFMALRAVVTWGVVDASFIAGSPDVCAAKSGACWSVVANKWRLVLFGLYPYDEQWRPAIALMLLVSLLFLTTIRRLWSLSLVALWLGGLTVVAVLMWGGVLGLDPVASDQWGGLPVTLSVAMFGLALAFPLSIFIALARTTKRLVVVRALASTYVECVRSVPMVTVLFMASIMFPLLLPDGANFPKLFRVVVAFMLFAAAYLAEVIRGGLESLPKGQEEAALALGMSYWKTAFLVLIPQALRNVVPSLVNTFIGFFKATSIVSIVGIFDILNAAQRSAADPNWQAYGFEIFVFVGAIYFCFCFSMSRYGRRFERKQP
jgi:general L-amino acid transport system permease protein